MAKWFKATDCKSVIRGFESHCRLCLFVPIFTRKTRFSVNIAVFDIFRYPIQYRSSGKPIGSGTDTENRKTLVPADKCNAG